MTRAIRFLARVGIKPVATTDTASDAVVGSVRTWLLTREEAMKRKRYLVVGAICLALLVALGIGEAVLEKPGVAQAQTRQAPVFEVDPFWPKPLPNHWLMGSTIGVSVDSRDHVWVIHRQTTFNERTEIGAVADPPTSECCIPAPNVLEFDQAGNLVGHWGGPGEGYDWP